MSKLSLIEAEAGRLVGRFAGPARDALTRELVGLCEAHWRELRGPAPADPLAHALWSVAPPLAELFVDLHAAGDARLAALLEGLRPARADAQWLADLLTREGARFGTRADLGADDRLTLRWA